jgi:hypothetical protein
MSIARISALLLISFVLLGCERSNGSFVCHFGVPGGDAYAIAHIAAKHINEHYAFADRTTVNRTHSGKIYYVSPGCVPSFTFYEIVEPSDIREIEELAKQSLSLAGIDRVSLVFYERQNWVTASPSGGGHRGHEHAVKEIIIEK